MKFLIHSKEGDGISLARRLRKEKQEVSVYIDSPAYRRMGDGLVDKASNMEDAISAGVDCVVFDREGSGEMADQLRARGINVFGASAVADRLELDRLFGLEFAASCGLALPKMLVVSSNAGTRKRMLALKETLACGESFDDARQFLRDNEGEWVLKPCGNMLTSLTYLAKNSLDMLYMLERLCNMGESITDFVLQKRVYGHELSCEGWFNGEDWIEGSLNCTVEDKKFLNRDLGPNTGCAGNVVFTRQDFFDRHFYPHVFSKLGEKLAAAHFTGPIDVNAIWNDAGPLFLEFTPRFGYDALQAFMQLVQSDMAELIAKCSAGERMRVYTETRAFAAAVRASIPPYPHSDADVPNGVLIDGVDPSDLTVFPSDARVENGRLVSAGADGNILTVTGIDGTWCGAVESCYMKLSKISAADLQYRTDVGQRMESALAFLSADRSEGPATCPPPK